MYVLPSQSFGITKPEQWNINRSSRYNNNMLFLLVIAMIIRFIL